MKVYERHFTDRKRDDNPCVVNSMPEQCILRHVRYWENGSALEKNVEQAIEKKQATIYFNESYSGILKIFLKVSI